ncbi:tyrosine-type recombinase/integrase [Clostridium collagenovorans]
MRFHDTRHCCAQQLYLLGVDEKTVSDLLGHYTPVLLEILINTGTKI